MNILITGGLGFIGSHLVAELSKQHTIDIIDNFTESYPGHKYIHRGNKGLQQTNSIESYHRNINLRYRLDLINLKFRKLYRQWTFELTNEIKNNKYDLIINCGALCEAILSQYFKGFTHRSIVSGLKNIKTFFSDTPCLHISSSMVYGTWEEVIDEQYSLASENPYGLSKILAEKTLNNNDVILRPIHVYGMGDGKFSVWMNIDRQVSVNKPVLVEEAGCIFIEDFILAIKNIVDKWIPGSYNICYDFSRTRKALHTVSDKQFETKVKLGPTGKTRGILDCSKLKSTFDIQFKYLDYESTIEKYNKDFQNFCKK